MSWAEGVALGVPLTPLVVLFARWARRTLLFLPAPQKWHLSSGLFVSYCSLLTQLRMCAVIFSPL